MGTVLMCKGTVLVCTGTAALEELLIVEGNHCWAAVIVCSSLAENMVLSQQVKCTCCLLELTSCSLYTPCPQKKHVTTFSTISLTISFRLQ